MKAYIYPLLIQSYKHAYIILCMNDWVMILAISRSSDQFTSQVDQEEQLSEQQSSPLHTSRVYSEAEEQV